MQKVYCYIKQKGITSYIYLFIALGIHSIGATVGAVDIVIPCSTEDLSQYLVDNWTLSWHNDTDSDTIVFITADGLEIHGSAYDNNTYVLNTTDYSLIIVQFDVYVHCANDYRCSIDTGYEEVSSISDECNPPPKPVLGDICLSSPCLNGGTCVVIGPTYYACFCIDTYMGANCQESLAEEQDYEELGQERRDEADSKNGLVALLGVLVFALTATIIITGVVTYRKLKENSEKKDLEEVTTRESHSTESPSAGTVSTFQSGSSVASGDTKTSEKSVESKTSADSKESEKSFVSRTSGASKLSGKSGASKLSGKSGASKLSGKSGASKLSGKSGASKLSGKSGASKLSGKSGASKLSGKSGASKLSGKSGASKLSGKSVASKTSGASKLSGKSVASKTSDDSKESSKSAASAISGASELSGECVASDASDLCEKPVASDASDLCEKPVASDASNLCEEPVASGTTIDSKQSISSFKSAKSGAFEITPPNISADSA